jgi:hypothetical protein
MHISSSKTGLICVKTLLHTHGTNNYYYFKFKNDLRLSLNGGGLFLRAPKVVNLKSFLLHVTFNFEMRSHK